MKKLISNIVKKIKTHLEDRKFKKLLNDNIFEEDTFIYK
jgi:hypothetical protein